MAPALSAQTATRKAPIEALDQFSNSVQQLAARVAPAVVQISVTRYASRDDSGDHTGVVLDREKAVGSGAVIDPDGYIVTNAHVVANALRIRVTRPSEVAPSPDKPDQAITGSLAQALTGVNYAFRSTAIISPDRRQLLLRRRGAPPRAEGDSPPAAVFWFLVYISGAVGKWETCCWFSTFPSALAAGAVEMWESRPPLARFPRGWWKEGEARLWLSTLSTAPPFPQLTSVF